MNIKLLKLKMKTEYIIIIKGPYHRSLRVMSYGHRYSPVH